MQRFFKVPAKDGNLYFEDEDDAIQMAASCRARIEQVDAIQVFGGRQYLLVNSCKENRVLDGKRGWNDRQEDTISVSVHEGGYQTFKSKIKLGDESFYVHSFLTCPDRYGYQHIVPDGTYLAYRHAGDSEFESSTHLFRAPKGDNEQEYRLQAARDISGIEHGPFNIVKREVDAYNEARGIYVHKAGDLFVLFYKNQSEFFAEPILSQTRRVEPPKSSDDKDAEIARLTQRIAELESQQKSISPRFGKW